MDFRDKDGAPLVKWTTPEECFEAWKECSRGRPCDYTGMSYDKLRGGSGIQWPCNDERPDGTERLYTDRRFATVPEFARTTGTTCVTGAAVTAGRLKALGADGRALLKAAECTPPHEGPGDEYPFWLTTGRIVYHFHTRTKTGRAPELHAAAPDAWVELCPSDAERLGIAEGDMVGSRRPAARSRPRHGRATSAGLVFVPFHYGYWDRRRRRARRPPASRQRADDDRLGPGLQATAAQDGRREARADRMKLGRLLAHLDHLEARLAATLRAAADRHAGDHDVFHQCQTFALTAATRANKLERFTDRYRGDGRMDTTPCKANATTFWRTCCSCTSRLTRWRSSGEMAAQTAKAARDANLLSLATQPPSTPRPRCKPSGS